MTFHPTNDNSIATVEWHFPLDDERREKLTLVRQTVDYYNFFQSPEWLNAIQHEGPRFIVSLDASENVVAYSLLTVARSKLHIPEAASVVRGPIAINFNAMKLHTGDLLQFVQGDYASIRVNPCVAGSSLQEVEALLEGLGFRICTDPNHYQHTIIVPVLDSAELQWRSIRRSVRTAINKAKRLEIAITHDTDARSYHEFVKYFSRFAKTKGIAAPLPETMAYLQRSLSDDRTTATYLLSARSGDRLLGQMLLLNNTGSLAYEWGWSENVPDKPRVPIMHSLVWKALEICRDKDIAFVDLGGYWIERGPDDPNNHFKLGFSKSIEKFCGEYEYVLSKTKNTVRQKLLGLRALLKRLR